MEEVERTFSFAEFELDTAKRRLLNNGENVSLNPKALDLLTVLVKNHGHIVTKNETARNGLERSIRRGKQPYGSHLRTSQNIRREKR